MSYGTVVNVLDADSGAQIGATEGLQRCHGIALANGLDEGFVTDGGSGKVVVFDTKSLQITGEIKAESDTDFILYDSASKRVFSFNGHSKNATVIDAAKKTVIATISVGGIPKQAVSDGNGTVYDNIDDTNEVLPIDARTAQIKTRGSLAPDVGQLVSMAMDREHRRLFIGGRNPKTLVVVNADNGKVLQSFPITKGVEVQAGCESILPRFLRAFGDDLSRLVHQRAARKPISDARTATYVILSTGSGPGGRRFKSFRPDHFNLGPTRTHG